MLDTFISFVQSVPWQWVLLFGMFVTYLENIFPPSPSDTVIVFMGALVATGDVGFFPLLLSTTIGSTLGFITMFWLGLKFETRVIESNKFSFISRDLLFKVENWFQKWGYWLIVINRFLSGTRAVIAFFAGMSKLGLRKTTALSFVSALVWNAILLYLGFVFGDNWQSVERYMHLYGYIIMPSIAFLVICFVVFRVVRNRLARNKNEVRP